MRVALAMLLLNLAGCGVAEPYPSDSPLGMMCSASREVASAAAAGRSGYEALEAGDRATAQESAQQARFHHQEAQALIGHGGLLLPEHEDQRAAWEGGFNAVQEGIQAAELLWFATINATPPSLDQWERLVLAVETKVAMIPLPSACKVPSAR